MTRQVSVTVRWRKMSSGKYSREWRHSAGHWAWLRMRSIIVCSFVLKRLATRVKCMKMRMRALGVRYSRNAMCGHCGLVLVFGDKWTSTRSGCGCPGVR